MLEENIRYPIPLGRGSIITITNDFGHNAPYLAEMKGVILSGAPEAKIIDITSNISQGDILGASFVLERIMPYYPSGTIHLVVVDPTVGSDRKPLAINVGYQIIVCPDNGLATLPVIAYGLYRAYHITNIEPPLKVVSPTFHGRDIFAPACVHLARGGSIKDLGEKVDEIVILNISKPIVKDNSIEGEIIYIDSFGNLISNIKEKDLVNVNKVYYYIEIVGEKIDGIKKYYAEVDIGKPVALIGSSGYLEIAIRDGNAKKIFNLNIGENIIVRKK
ncbi:MAG: SAM hydrolase/SAM-dependent halogenase family protein [bacterium]